MSTERVKSTNLSLVNPLSNSQKSVRGGVGEGRGRGEWGGGGVGGRWGGGRWGGGVVGGGGGAGGGGFFPFLKTKIEASQETLRGHPCTKRMKWYSKLK